VPVQQICFIGDDVNDLPALAIAGFSACPADARFSVRQRCNVVAKLGGGNGAVREIVDMILASASSKNDAAVLGDHGKKK
jgi:3-deoxy-D-manno-octulosonate 8-phosphate phosphatase (KDO 8-P phosphatase)